MKDKKFEDALKELENIVSQMETEGLGLDDSIKKYESGIKLAKFCREKLDKAEKKIEILTRKPDGSVELKNFLGNSDKTEPTNNTDLSAPAPAPAPNNCAGNNTKTDEPQSSYEPKINIIAPAEQDNKIIKLSDSSESKSEKETENIKINKIDEQVVPEKNDAVTSEMTEKETGNKPEGIQSYNEGLQTDKPETKFDDKAAELDKPKKVYEQKHKDSFEDLLF